MSYAMRYAKLCLFITLTSKEEIGEISIRKEGNLSFEIFPPVLDVHAFVGSVEVGERTTCEVVELGGRRWNDHAGGTNGGRFHCFLDAVHHVGVVDAEVLSVDDGHGRLAIIGVPHHRYESHFEGVLAERLVMELDAGVVLVLTFSRLVADIAPVGTKFPDDDRNALIDELRFHHFQL